jgi:hypothetical protein
MSEGPHRKIDKLNLLGVIVAGISGAVLVYVSIVLLHAFYLSDTAQIETMADYGGQDKDFRDIRSAQLTTIDPPQGKRNGQNFVIKIDKAIDLVVEDVKSDPSNLVPTQGKSVKSTILPVFGRPKMIPKDGAGAGSGSGAGEGSGSATDGAGAGSGSAAAPGSPPSPPATDTGGLGGPPDTTKADPGSGGGSAVTPPTTSPVRPPPTPKTVTPKALPKTPKKAPGAGSGSNAR